MEDLLNYPEVARLLGLSVRAAKDVILSDPARWGMLRFGHRTVRFDPVLVGEALNRRRLDAAVGRTNGRRNGRRKP
jgi:hypothetical protein